MGNQPIMRVPAINMDPIFIFRLGIYIFSWQKNMSGSIKHPDFGFAVL